jgi:hypothetical protein
MLATVSTVVRISTDWARTFGIPGVSVAEMVKNQSNGTIAALLQKWDREMP